MSAMSQLWFSSNAVIRLLVLLAVLSCLSHYIQYKNCGSVAWSLTPRLRLHYSNAVKMVGVYDASSLLLQESLSNYSNPTVRRALSWSTHIPSINRNANDNPASDNGVHVSENHTQQIQFKKSGRVITWLERAYQLHQFIQEHGHSRVPKRYGSNGTEKTGLGSWVQKQRQRRDRLSDDQINLLNRLGFIWNTTLYIPTATTCIPMNLNNSHASLFSLDGQQQWQRQHPLSKPTPSSSDQYWRWTRHDHQWYSRFQQLLQYKKLFGDCCVPVSYPENPALGRWVSSQRKQYHRHQQQLQIIEQQHMQQRLNMQSPVKPNATRWMRQQQRIQLLNSVDFVWKMQDHLASQWEKL